MFNYLLNIYQLRVLDLYEIKALLNSKLSEEPSLDSVQSDFERDDDDPLSIRSLSITSLGIIFLLTFYYLISILIEDFSLKETR